MTKQHTQTCAIAGFLNVFGDTWTLLIVREALFGTTRFSDFQRNTGAARNLLSERLSTLVEAGIFEKVEIGQSGTRHAYHLTSKGESLRSVIAAIVLWSNDNLYEENQEPSLLVSRKSGTMVREIMAVQADKARVEWSDLTVIAGRGANEATRRRLGTNSPSDRTDS